MQFPGYWISGNANSVIITRYPFDDTELTEASDWKEAHQNSDASLPHGFVRWSDALVDIERRLNGEIGCPPMTENSKSEDS